MIIKIVPDTNVIIGGMLGYHSPERKLLSLCLAKRVSLYGSSVTFKEFCEKIKEQRLQRYWIKKNFSLDKIILDYKSLVTMHEPFGSAASVLIQINDPKDEIFVRVSLSCGAKIIVSKDHHLLDLEKFQDIKIVTPQKFIDAYSKNYPVYSLKGRSQ